MKLRKSFSLAVFTIALTALPAFSQWAYSYSGYTTGPDENGNDSLDVWTVTEGGMSGVPTGGYTHTYYAAAWATGPNGTNTPLPNTNYTSADATLSTSVRQDSYMPIQYLGDYTLHEEGWAYCSFVGWSAPFYDTGDQQSDIPINDWATAWGIQSIDDFGHVVLSEDDYNTLVSQGYLAAGVGTVIVITNPELVPVLGAAIVLVAVAYLSYQAARQIKLNYDREILDYCRRKLVDCLERPQSQQVGDCSTCYGNCTNQGLWPDQMCPNT